jgi:hypothetical protein
MRDRTVRPSNLARAALVLALTGGCSPQPTTPPTTQAAPTASPSASVAAELEVTWEPFVRLGDMLDMVHGRRGWVALKDCPRGSCDLAATVWHSADLDTWATIELPQSGDILPISVSANALDYLVAAYDFDDVGAHEDEFLQVWRSSSGRFWDRVGELRLGACGSDHCPGVRGVGLAQNGAIVVGAVIPNEDDDKVAGQSYVSMDGVTWRETTIATFSNGNELDRIVVQAVESTPTDLFVVGQACSSTCSMTVWSTTDGVYWLEEQGFGTGVDRLAFASDGDHRVAAVTKCPTSSQCTTDVWTGPRSAVWTNVAPALDLAEPEVTWTGEGFVLIGVRGLDFAAYVSRDGSTWTDVPSDVLNGLVACDSRWLAGGDGTAMFGVPDCAVWRGNVEEAR